MLAFIVYVLTVRVLLPDVNAMPVRFFSTAIEIFQTFQGT
jgi:hypothetical protein